MIVGIDPGSAKGGVALLKDGWAEVHDLPIIKGHGVDCHALFDLLSGDDIKHAYVERVGVMPKQGGASGFKFGQGVGTIHTCVKLARIPFTLVTPTVWKRSLRLNRDKEHARARAIQLFPKLADRLSRKRDIDRAEALLIAHWGTMQ